MNKEPCSQVIIHRLRGAIKYNELGHKATVGFQGARRRHT